ncbi:uncharacterized protein LOC120342179 isoform X1 [Styela clava]
MEVSDPLPGSEPEHVPVVDGSSNNKDTGGQGGQSVAQIVPVIEVPISDTQTTEDVKDLVTVFAPIKPSERTDSYQCIDAKLNEDSSDRRLSREDIETMEIMQNENTDSKGIPDSWPNTPDTCTHASTPINGHVPDISTNEDSMASSITTTRSIDPILKQKNTFSLLTAADVIEYQWPNDGTGDYYMIQEQISSFLSITSFKRKYPEIERRKLDARELNHLMLNMLVSEVQVTLGLTAVRSRDVCDLMMREYPDKYQEYVNVLDEKRKESIKKKHLQYSAPTVEKSQMPSYLKKAMKQVSDFNARLNRQRRDEFGLYYDMQTNVLQIPQRKMKKVHPDFTRPSLYPCALIPGQFQEYCQKYTSDELNYFPLNTVVYGPPPPPPLDLLDSMDSDASEQESMDTETADSKSLRSIDEDGHTKESRVDKDNGPRDSTVSASSDNSDEAPKKGNTETGDRSSTTITTVTEIQNTDEDRNASIKNQAIKEEPDKDVSMSYIDDIDKPICGICLKDETSNKKEEPEDLISCSQCDNYGHPSCLDMSKDLVSVIVTYNWQCLECKTCTYCSKPHHEDKMMFCDRCDRGYHTFCVGLRNLPSGLWMCPQCTRSDPDFSKASGGKRSSTGTPRKRKSDASQASPAGDTPVKPKRKRRTKKEMEEAREKERLEKEEKLKKKTEKKKSKPKDEVPEETPAIVEEKTVEPKKKKHKPKDEDSEGTHAVVEPKKKKRKPKDEDSEETPVVVEEKTVELKKKKPEPKYEDAEGTHADVEEKTVEPKKKKPKPKDEDSEETPVVVEEKTVELKKKKPEPKYEDAEGTHAVVEEKTVELKMKKHKPKEGVPEETSAVIEEKTVELKMEKPEPRDEDLEETPAVVEEKNVEPNQKTEDSNIVVKTEDLS